MICHYWFFDHGFKFQDSVCNDFHDVTMLSVNLNNFAILTIANVDYLCIIHDFSKSESINSLENSVWRSWLYIKLHIQEINVKNQVYNYHFDNLLKAEKLETDQQHFNR